MGVTFSLGEWLRLDKFEMILGYRFGILGLKLVLGVEFYCGVEKCLIWIPLLGMLEEWFGLGM